MGEGMKLIVVALAIFLILVVAKNASTKTARKPVGDDDDTIYG